MGSDRFLGNEGLSGEFKAVAHEFKTVGSDANLEKNPVR
jgi:hypothetical protein